MDGILLEKKSRHGRLLRTIASVLVCAMLIWILSSSLNWVPASQQTASVRPEGKAVNALLARPQPTNGRFVLPSGPSGSQAGKTAGSQAAAAPLSESMQKLVDAYATARTEISRANYALALVQVDECLRLDDGTNRDLTIDLWLKKGALHAMLGETAQALAGLDQALAIAPETAEAWLAKSQIQADASQFPQAIDSLSAYLRLEPADTRVYANMAELRYNAGEYAAATVECTIYLDRCNGSDAAVYFLRGSARVKLLNYAAASDDFLTAMRFGRDKADCLSQAAYCQLMLKDYAAAILHCTAYLEQCDAGNGAIRALRASCHAQLESYQAAADDYLAAAALGYEAAECSEQAAYCQLMLKSYAAAIQSGEQALQLGRNSETLYQQLGVAALGLEQAEKAAGYFTKSIELDPELAMNHYYRGVCLMSLKKYADARSDFTQSLARGDMVQVCYYNRGICQIYLKQYKEAKSDMEQAVSTGSDAALAKSASDVLKQLA